MTTRKSGMIGYLIKIMPEKDDKFSSYYKNKNILITGASGYLGGSIVDMLSRISCRIIALDTRSSMLKPRNGQIANISQVKGNIKDKNIWLKYLKDINIVFHLAAQTSSSFANENLLNDVEINLLPIVNLIETCYKNKLRPDVVFSGTVTETGLTDKLPVNEMVKDNPITIYDMNKFSAEKYLQYYGNQMGGRSVTLRLANVYGPSLTDSGSIDRGILNKMVSKALKGEDLTVYGDGDFVRDYIYVSDVVAAFLMAGSNMDKVNGKYYIVGTDSGHSIKDMMGMIRDEAISLTNKNIHVRHIPSPCDLSPIEFRNFIADSSNFKNATGWNAEVSLREGINRTATYFFKKLVQNDR